MRTMKIVVVGSITEDVIKTPSSKLNRFIGGVPVYAASVATALNEWIGVVSKVGLDFPVKNLRLLKKFNADLAGLKISGNTSMRFENRYDSTGVRTQRLLSSSEPISIKDLPSQYYNTPIIHLGPVFNEIDVELLSQVRGHFKIISLDGQGFTRTVAEQGQRIVLEPWLHYEDYLPKIDILKVDDTELKSITSANTLQEGVEKVLETGLKLLVITRAHKGAIIYQGKKRYDIPAFPTKVADATGAGDTFITAFLFEYFRTKDSYNSGLFAAATASFKISTAGPIPRYNRSDVLARLREFPLIQEKK
ncbi:MAG: hypothetical protein GF308_13720 [Candidatus Heimdallarchaeota archaeon]|nr:hypothetical protein [Candidatus Heimdallarchaeota archaeon]